MSDPTNQDPFNNTATPDSQSPAAPAPSQDPFADQLNMIKNENGEAKYDSVPKALEGLQHAQNYIPQLKTDLETKDAEIAQLRADLEKRASVEEVVSRLQPNQQTQVTETTPAQVAGLDEQAVTQLLETIITQKEQATAMQTNRQRVNSKLNELYADRAPEMIANKAGELGMSASNLGELANTQPDLVLALFNTAPSKGPSPTTNSFNIPPTHTKTEGMAAPTKSLLAGATGKEQAEYMAQIQRSIYEKYGVTQ